MKPAYERQPVKVAFHKLVNPYPEFTISFGKGVGMAKLVK